MSTNSTIGSLMEKSDTVETTNVEPIQPNNAIETIDPTPVAEPTPIVESTPQNEPTPTEPIETVVDEPVDFVEFNLGGDKPTQPTTPENPTKSNFSTWEDEIKKQDINKVAEVLGLDPFVIELNQHLKNGGSAADYLAAKAIDYNKVSDADLLKQEVANKYPHLDPSERERIFNKKYGISEFDDEDTQIDKTIALKADAYEIRQKKIAEQANFKIPETPKQNNEILEQIKAEQLRAEKEIQFIQNHEATKNLFSNKRVVVDLGEGVPPFNFGLDKPEAIMELFSNEEKWRKALANEQGEPDVAKMNRIALAVLNPNYEKALFNYGKSIGRKERLIEAQNAKKPTGAMPSGNTNGVVVTNLNGSLGRLMNGS